MGLLELVLLTPLVELAAIAAAVTHDHNCIGTDSLDSIHQIKKELLCPEKHRHHVQKDLLKKITNLIRNSETHISLSIKSRLMLDLLVMSVQTPLPSIKPFRQGYKKKRPLSRNARLLGYTCTYEIRKSSCLVFHAFATQEIKRISECVL